MSDRSIDIGPFCLVIDNEGAWFVFNPTKHHPVCANAAEEMALALQGHETLLRGKRLIANLQDAPVIDSLQIGALVALSKACRPFGRLALAHVSEPVGRLLRITAIERLFDIIDGPAVKPWSEAFINPRSGPAPSADVR